MNKISVCIYSNQNKINPIDLNRWNQFFLQFNNEVDYFCHFWDFNEFSEKELTFNIKKFLIESDIKKNEILNEYKLENIKEDVINYYSLMRASYLKKEYEIQNQFFYDVCFALCIDKVFTNDELKIISKNVISTKKNSIYTYNLKTLNDFPYYQIDNKFYYSNSLTFNKLGEFYRFLPTFNEKSVDVEETPIGSSFYYYIKALKIKNINNKTIDNIIGHI
jgi:hypothetical protein